MNSAHERRKLLEVEARRHDVGLGDASWQDVGGKPQGAERVSDRTAHAANRILQVAIHGVDGDAEVAEAGVPTGLETLPGDLRSSVRLNPDGKASTRKSRNDLGQVGSEKRLAARDDRVPGAERRQPSRHRFNLRNTELAFFIGQLAQPAHSAPIVTAVGQMKADVEGMAQESGAQHSGGGVEDLHTSTVDRTPAKPNPGRPERISQVLYSRL